MTRKMRMVDTYSPKHFRTSTTYRVARKQQRTATRKSFFDAEGMRVSASEWATLVLSGEVNPKTSWSNDNVKGKLNSLSPRSHFTKKGYKEFCGKSHKFSEALDEGEIVFLDIEVVADYTLWDEITKDKEASEKLFLDEFQFLR